MFNHSLTDFVNSFLGIYITNVAEYMDSLNTHFSTVNIEHAVLCPFVLVTEKLEDLEDPRYS